MLNNHKNSNSFKVKLCIFIATLCSFGVKKCVTYYPIKVRPTTKEDKKKLDVAMLAAIAKNRANQN